MVIRGPWLHIATGGAIALAVLQCSNANAQQASVTDTQGIPVGGFRFYPALQVTGYYDDNVFLSSDAPRSDTVELIVPSVALRSNWSINQLALDATATLRRYNVNTEQNTTEFEGGASGELDIDATSPITGSLRAGHKAQVLGSPGDDNPFGRYVLYDFVDAAVGITKGFNRLTLGINGTASNDRYDPLHILGTTIDQSALDRNLRGLSGQVQYTYSSITVPYVSVSYNTVKFVHPGELSARHQTGISILLGTSFEFSRLFSGNVAIGYLKHKFGSAAYPDFAGLNFQANLTYKPTRLDTLQLNASRSVVNSALIGVPGVLQSDFSLNEVHELTRRMSIAASLVYDREVYRGIDRRQNRYTGSIAVKRTLNRYIAVSVGYTRLQLDSTGDAIAQNYTDNRLSMNLSASR